MGKLIFFTIAAMAIAVLVIVFSRAANETRCIEKGGKVIYNNLNDVIGCVR